ncbi:MAG TPA: vanadium-dependent haloperoxidase [Opitutaceae bacterium]|nr:vanadium-dependent haloperoxidase [Opitutaceae bacterium]
MNRPTYVSTLLRPMAVAAFLCGIAPCVALADAVTDWNAALESSLAFPSERGPAAPARTYAILHAAMFDAVNGIARKYEPLHVTDAAPPGARAEAAAIQAAYSVLSSLRPGSQAIWDAQLAASLAALPGSEGNSTSIARGREWGMAVASAILAWRTGDIGTVPGTVPGPTTIGWWLFTPEARPFAGRPNLVTVPFLVADPTAFDPGPPYGLANRTDVLASAAYAADLNEVFARGGTTSAVRTPQDEFMALFINACDQATLNRMLRENLSPGSQLVENARLFALFNVAFFDTAIVLFKSKYVHQFWRPYQAIGYAGLAINPTFQWSLRPTPPHPEYPSAHVTLFTALVQVAARIIGERPVALYAPGYADPVGFPSMAAVADANVQARVDIGFHFRETGEVSQVVGRAIADYLVEECLTPAH